jgi:uncharacterized protein YutE (UPF0331/DUF86 family)
MTAAEYTFVTHLDHLKQFIKKLELYQDMVDKKRFLTDPMAQDAILKALEQITEAMITIATMMIAQRGFRKAENNEDLFTILAEAKVYPAAFGEQLKGLGGFRNILVHDYININLELVYKNLKRGLPLFKTFARYIAKFI